MNETKSGRTPMNRTNGGVAMLSRLAMVSLAVAVGVSSCATERPIVDQVQTNIISKSVFSGEWYYTRTVVDLDESGG